MGNNVRQARATRECCKTRAVAIYLMLSTGQTLSSRAILKKLKCQYGMVVDRKTIFDDIRAIDRIMPIEVVTGRDGGYRKLDVLGRCGDAD